MQKVIDAGNLAVAELEKEFVKSRIDREVLSAERNYRYDAVIRNDKGSIGVETCYMPDGTPLESFVKRIDRFELETPELPSHLIAFVTDSPLCLDTQQSIRSILIEREKEKNKPFFVRFYSFEALPSAE
jgi:hypothetical protein